MSNILAITHKELKSYFSSPIAYVVIGLYALVFGYYFYAAVRFFDRQSMQMMGLGAGSPSVNINEQLIRPVFQYSMVVFLIVLPMITMRTYSEEKRSGTMELLLTSPLTDFQIIMGKFLGAMGLYASMLGVTVLHMGLLFWVSRPEWMPIVTSYLGLLLMGGCFMSVGLLISSFTKNQIVAVVATFAVFMMLWMINWIAHVHGTDDAGGPQLHVDHQPPRGLHGRRDRHQAPGLLPQLHRIRAVPDRPVGGHRAVEGLTMVQRILGILSWVGVVLVFGALVVRFTKPEWDQYATWAAWAGLGLVVLYTLGQWREIVRLLPTAERALRHHCRRQRDRRARHPRRRQLPVGQAQQAVGPDREQAVQPLGTVDEAAGESSVAGEVHGVRPGDRASNDSGRGSRPTSTARARSTSTTSTWTRIRCKTKEYKVDTYGTIVIEYMGRTERVTTDAEQDITNALIKVVNPTAKKVYFLSGHGEKDPGNSDRKIGYSTIADSLKRDNYEFATLALAQTNEIPMDATVLVIAGPRTDLLEQEVPLITAYLTSRSGKLLVLLDPPENIKEPATMPRLTGLLDEWGIKATESVVVDVSGLTSNPTAPVAAPPYPSHAITNNFGFVTMFPLVRNLQAQTSPQKRSGQTFLQTSARSWAEMSLTSLTDQKAGVSADPAKGDIPGPVSIGVATAVPAPTPEPDAGRQHAEARGRGAEARNAGGRDR